VKQVHELSHRYICPQVVLSAWPDVFFKADLARVVRVLAVLEIAGLSLYHQPVRPRIQSHADREVRLQLEEMRGEQLQGRAVSDWQLLGVDPVNISVVLESPAVEQSRTDDAGVFSEPEERAEPRQQHHSLLGLMGPHLNNKLSKLHQRAADKGQSAVKTTFF
jgi:hypothetical protein